MCINAMHESNIQPEPVEKVELAMAELPSIPKELIHYFVRGSVRFGKAINTSSVAFRRALIG